MLDKNIAKQSLTYAAGAALYIIVVASVMQNADRLFGGPGPDSPLAPIAALSLLVVSAATMGLLVFGKPVMLYIDGKKKEAVTMVTYTVAFLAAFTFLVFAYLATHRG